MCCSQCGICVSRFSVLFPVGKLCFQERLVPSGGAVFPGLVFSSQWGSCVSRCSVIFPVGYLCFQDWCSVPSLGAVSPGLGIVFPVWDLCSLGWCSVPTVKAVFHELVFCSHCGNCVL